MFFRPKLQALLVVLNCYLKSPGHSVNAAAFNHKY